MQSKYQISLETGPGLLNTVFLFLEQFIRDVGGDPQCWQTHGKGPRLPLLMLPHFNSNNRWKVKKKITLIEAEEKLFSGSVCWCTRLSPLVTTLVEGGRKEGSAGCWWWLREAGLPYGSTTRGQLISLPHQL